MKILVINSGSSSIKYQLFNMTEEEVLAKGIVERIGIEGSRLEQEDQSGEEFVIEEEIKDHNKGMKLVVNALIDQEYGVIDDIDEIDAVGHRVVHGGEYFADSVVVDSDVKEKIEECSSLAPLHNPANLMGIDVCEELMPQTPQVATFDSAFHQSMPEKAYLYPLPYEYYEQHKIRRYGFHGTSHKFVAESVAKEIGEEFSDLKIITCHLGNGASVTAIEDGKSKDTSMGFTPLEGLMMGTRCGDLDPAIIPFIMQEEDLSAEEVDYVLNNESGILGVFEKSSDFRDIEDGLDDGDERAKLTFDMFNYRVQKYIGSYAAVMNGVDALVFTAGVGENGIEVREEICKDLGYIGIEIDQERNDVRGKLQKISTDDSTVDVYVVPTNEELVIARDTKNLIG